MKEEVQKVAEQKTFYGFLSECVSDSVNATPPTPRSERDEGIERVAKRKFQTLGLALIVRNWRSGDELTGEDVRLAGLNRGLEPHHPNAWGALIMHAVRQKLLVATGEYRAPTAVKSHARKIQVYRRV